MHLRVAVSIVAIALCCEAAYAEHDHHHDERESHHESAVVELPYDKAKAEGIRIVRVGPGAVQNILTLHGEISLNGNSIVHVSPRFPGVLKRVEKDLGDFVKSGDLLAIVQSNESLTSYEIHAEVDGTVIEKDATRGEFVRDEKVLFIIANLATVWVNAAIYPDDLEKIGRGREVIVRGRPSSMQQRGTISYIRPSLSEVTRTALARIVLSNDDRRWVPGMFVSVDVLLDPQSSEMVVPSESIVLVENRPSLFLKEKSDDGHDAFRCVPVTVGRTDGEYTEILSGVVGGTEVAAGETFILKAELGKGSAAHEH